MQFVLPLLAFLLVQNPATTQTATIEGVAVKLGTSEPIARARIVLLPADPGARSGQVTATAGADGRFSLVSIPPGRYRLIATRDGYVRTEFGQRTPNAAGTPVTLSPGQQVRDVRFAMTPAGAVAGRIFDAAGDPVGNATVQAMRYVYREGKRTLTTAQAVRTNDLGEYRLFWLQPGAYVISVTPTPEARLESGLPALDLGGRVSFEAAVVAGGPRLQGPAMLAGLDNADGVQTVYHPGTMDPAAAMPVDVRPGANFGGVDLVVTDAKLVKIRGRVVSGNTAQPMGNASVTLIARGISGGPGSGRTARVDANGEFEIRGVAPGTYDLVASSGMETFVSFGGPGGNDQRVMVFQRAEAVTPGTPPTTPRPPSAENVRLGGRMTVDVGNADLEGVTIPMQQGVVISGRIALDQTGSPNPSGAGALRILLRPEPAIPQLTPLPGTTNPDGTFSIPGVLPGDYRLTVVGVPRGSYVKSASLNSADALNDLIRIDGDVRGGLNVLIGSNTGTAEGLVQNEKQEPVAGVEVVLVPAVRSRGDMYRRATTDASGRFRIENVAPGDYKLFAWEDVETGAWQDPAFLGTYESLGRPVRITEGGRDMATLTWIPYAPYIR